MQQAASPGCSSDAKVDPQTVCEIKGFKTLKELERHAQKLQLKRIMIAELGRDTDLLYGYIGGWVVATHALSYSQGHNLSVYLRDESVDETQEDSVQLRVEVEGVTVARMPTLMSENFMLFVHGGEVVPNVVEYSHDHSHCLLAKPPASIWLVHRDAHKAGFFQRKTCKEKWFKRQKKQAQIEQASRALTKSTDKSSQSGGDQGSNNDYTLPQDYFFPDVAAIQQINQLSPANETSSSSECSSSEEDNNDSYWVPKSRQENSCRKYQYTKLSELKPGEKKINLIAVVKDFTEIGPTHGTDLYCTMLLVDESNSQGVKCIAFNRSQDKLPQVRRIGDIVSLHRVYTQEYESKLQVVCNHIGSAQRFSGRVGQSLKVLTGSLSYTLTPEDKRRVKALRLWYQQQGRVHCQRLEDVTGEYSFGLVCQVLAVSRDSESVALSVWDGTKASLSLHTKQVGEVVRLSPALKAIACGLDCLIIITDQQLQQQALTFNPGNIVLINCVNPVSSGLQVELIVRDSTIEALSQRDSAYLILKTALKTFSIAQSAVTTTPHISAPYITISGLQRCVDTPIRAHLRAKVLCMLTPTLEDTVHIECSTCNKLFPISPDTMLQGGIVSSPCAQCSMHTLQCSYAFQIVLTDLSGASLQVHVVGENALKLLNGPKPTNYYQYQLERYQLLSKLTILTGDNPPFSSSTEQHRPWIDCCVLKIEHELNCYYFMFDTSMLNNSPI